MSFARNCPAQGILWTTCRTSHNPGLTPGPPLRPCLGGAIRHGWKRSRRGRRTGSGSSGCRRCSSGSATRSAAFDSIHVVGTKGKSTATRTIAALLAAEGLHTGAYTSPHVAGWWERLDTDAEGFETAVARVRAEAEARRRDPVRGADGRRVRRLRGARGGGRRRRGGARRAVRRDERRSTRRVVLLTNVGLEHTEVLGETRARDRQGEARRRGPGRDRRAAGRRVRVARRRRTR